MNSTPMDQNRPPFLTPDQRGRVVFFLIWRDAFWVVRSGTLEYFPDDHTRNCTPGRNPTYTIRLDEEVTVGIPERDIFESQASANHIMDYRNRRLRGKYNHTQRCPRCGKYGVRPGGVCRCGFSPSKITEDRHV